MKKLMLTLIITISLFACKNDKSVNLEENRAKSYNQNDGFITLKGDFFYDEAKNAAILQIDNQIFGVVINDVIYQLSKKAKEFQEEETDMVTITARVRKFEKQPEDDGWQYRVEIKDVLNIEPIGKADNNVIKLAK